MPKRMIVTLGLMALFAYGFSAHVQHDRRAGVGTQTDRGCGPQDAFCGFGASRL